MSKAVKAFLLVSIAGLIPYSAMAQDFGLGAAQPSLQTETLGAALDFDAGILTEDALDTNLWQGTSAGRAAQLLLDAPLKDKNPIIRDMVRTVVLSGGVPPRAQDETQQQAYEAARLKSVLALEGTKSGESKSLDGFLAKNPDLASSPLAQVDLAFSKGEWERACEISDTITTERAKPEWARLRAACHGLRGEISAADVTRDLLRSSGYDNPAYHSQMDALLTGQPPSGQKDPADALITYLANRGPALAGSAPQGTGKRAELTALFKNFSETDLDTLKSGFGNLSFDVSKPDLSLEQALSVRSPRSAGRLFILAQSGDAAAMEAFIKRARQAGVSEDDVLSKLAPMIQALPAAARADVNLPRYTRAAILGRDIESLQQLYGILPKGDAQARIALIADAIGGGFNGQSLGRDIEGRLSDPVKRRQAVKDTQMALALGATLSDEAADVLAKQSLPRLSLPQNQLLLLESAVREDSRAETSLIAASLLTRPGLNVTDKAYLVDALTRTGLQRFAGQISADVFFEGLK